MEKNKKELEKLTIIKLKEIALKEKVDLSKSIKKLEVINSIISSRNEKLITKKSDIRFKKLMSFKKSDLLNIALKLKINVFKEMTKEEIIFKTYK
ncbi:MAG: hypothetical protein K4H23_01860, partial [Mollicutes bacterium PWAP]|nr:hypothetical protein [Mollicutes bacterium PWAP]